MKEKNNVIMRLSLCALFIFLLAGLVSARMTSRRYMRLAENEYQNSIYGLTESVGKINTLLEKGLCVSSSGQFARIAAKLGAESERSKILLAQLPVSRGRLENVSRFFAQVGNYAMSIKGDSLGDEDYKRLSALFESSKSLRLALEELIARSDSAGWESELMKLESSIESGSALTDLDDTDKGFTGYESLVYDGPFSDHIYERKPAAIEKKEETTLEKAQENASKLTGRELAYAGKSDGVIPAYIFGGDNVEIGVCSKGGDVVYMIDSSDKGESKISSDDAAKQADAFVKSSGYDGMERVSFMTEGNACTFNYAYSQDGVIYYPDQVKVTVSLANGEISGFDTRDYLMNHRERAVQSFAHTQGEAQEKIAKYLTVEGCRPAVIMTEGLNERLCYEFECKSRSGADALVYINAETLEEENVLIVHESEYGITAA